MGEYVIYGTSLICWDLYSATDKKTAPETNCYCYDQLPMEESEIIETAFGHVS